MKVQLLRKKNSEFDNSGKKTENISDDNNNFNESHIDSIQKESGDDKEKVDGKIDKGVENNKRSSVDLTNPKLFKSNEDVWKIPIRIKFYGETEYDSALYMLENEEIRIEKKTSLYKINNNAAGYYVTNYTNEEMVKNLLESKKLGEKDRLNLLEDTFHLIRGSVIPVTSALNIIKYFEEETNSDIMSSLITELSDIKSIFYRDDIQRNKIRNTILELVKDKVGDVFDNITGQNLKFNELTLHTTILGTAVHNEHEETISTLGKLFEGYKKDKKSIHPNFRNPMFISLMKRYNNGEKELFDELYSLWVEEKAADVKNNMLMALGASNNFDFLSKKLLSDEIETQDKMYLFASLTNNILTRDRLVSLTIANFSKIQEIFEGNSSLMGYVIERVFGCVSRREIRDNIINHLKGANIEEVDRSVKKCLEKSEIKIRFRDANLKQFE